jgi:glycosyltransferase involved in cell wall biosynthesis
MRVPRSAAELKSKLFNRASRASWLGLREAVAEARQARHVQDDINLVEALDFSAADLDANRACLHAAALLDQPIRSINWYLPFFHYAFYGGIHTILRFASGFLDRHDVRSTLIVYDRPDASPAELKARVVEAFPSLASMPLLVLKTTQDPVPDADASIATFWTSAFVVMKNRAARRKFYFVQDYEPLFYQAGSLYALVEQTYRFGFPAIVNTPGLAETLVDEFGADAVSFTPCTDPAIFFPPKEPRPQRPFRVFFYGRPDTPRNAFEIGLSALRRFKARRGDDVEVLVAGSHFPESIKATSPGIRFMGLLPYRETGDLYRSCHAGLALMLTKHPSYLPFELMSCGAVPVVNENRVNKWLLRHDENAVMVEPTPTLLCDALEKLMDHGEWRDRLSQAGARLVRSYDWDSQIARVLEFMNARGAPASPSPAVP